MIKIVQHLIISNSLDYTSDYICLELKRRGASYLRVNRDKFSEYEVAYSIDDDKLKIKMGGILYVIEKSLNSIYFRAPVFLRAQKNYTVEEQLYRSQWGAFTRNMILFDGVRWINNPVNIYRAENKLYQLHIAKRMGLDIPRSYVANTQPEFIDETKRYVVKSLDTALFYENGQEMFTYTIVCSGEELKKAELAEAPVIIQEYIEEKIDLRVTIVGEQIYPVKILGNDVGIEGDWRKKSKNELSYVPVELPRDIKEKLQRFMKKMNLVFGGVDLAYSKGTYYFIEVNPTGEWAWLMNTARVPIDRAIVDYMEGKNE